MEQYNEENKGPIVYVADPFGKISTCYAYYVNRMILRGFRQVPKPLEHYDEPGKPELMTIKEAAASLGVKTQTIRNYMAQGKLYNIGQKGKPALDRKEVENFNVS